MEQRVHSRSYAEAVFSTSHHAWGCTSGLLFRIINKYNFLFHEPIYLIYVLQYTDFIFFTRSTGTVRIQLKYILPFLCVDIFFPGSFWPVHRILQLFLICHQIRVTAPALILTGEKSRWHLARMPWKNRDVGVHLPCSFPPFNTGARAGWRDYWLTQQIFECS